MSGGDLSARRIKIHQLRSVPLADWMVSDHVHSALEIPYVKAATGCRTQLGQLFYDGRQSCQGRVVGPKHGVLDPKVGKEGSGCSRGDGGEAE
jgi:hypothetical protein